MKVLFVHHAAGYGGSSRSLGILLPHLIRRGIAPHILTPPGVAADYFRQITPHVTTLDPHCFSLSMTVVGMKNNRYEFARSFARPHKRQMVKRILAHSDAPIVHCNEIGLVQIAKIAHRLGKKVVGHARTMPHKDYPTINRWVQHQANRFFDHTVCITGSVFQSLDRVKTKSIIYNPIESIPTPRPRAPHSTVVFLSLSAIQKSKGVFDIVEAAHLLRDHPHIKIKIAGKLTPHNPAHLSLKQRCLSRLGLVDFTTTNRLLTRIDQYNLNNLELLGHVKDIDAEIAQCDVILAPMHLNAPPRSVYEAGIHGLPSIVSMEDKIEDVIENNVTGLLIDEQSPQQLAQAMLKLADDASLRKKLGRQARERYLKNHDPETCAEALFQIYQRVLATD